MAIDINSINSSHIRPGEKQQVERQEVAAAPSPVEEKDASTQDTVHLTDRVKSLQKLSETIDKLPVIDAQKVMDIKQAIANGSFKVNPESIAEKILKTAE